MLCSFIRFESQLLHHGIALLGARALCQMACVEAEPNREPGHVPAVQSRDRLRAVREAVLNTDREPVRVPTTIRSCLARFVLSLPSAEGAAALVLRPSPALLPRQAARARAVRHSHNRAVAQRARIRSPTAVIVAVQHPVALGILDRGAVAVSFTWFALVNSIIYIYIIYIYIYV